MHTRARRIPSRAAPHPCARHELAHKLNTALGDDGEELRVHGTLPGFLHCREQRGLLGHRVACLAYAWGPEDVPPVRHPSPLPPAHSPVWCRALASSTNSVSVLWSVLTRLCFSSATGV